MIDDNGSRLRTVVGLVVNGSVQLRCYCLIIVMICFSQSVYNGLMVSFPSWIAMKVIFDHVTR